MIYFQVRDINFLDDIVSEFQFDALPTVFLEEYINDMPPANRVDITSALFNMKSSMILDMEFKLKETPGFDMKQWAMKIFSDIKSGLVDPYIMIMSFYNSTGVKYRRFFVHGLLDYSIDDDLNARMKLAVTQEVAIED